MQQTKKYHLVAFGSSWGLLFVGSAIWGDVRVCWGVGVGRGRYFVAFYCVWGLLFGAMCVGGGWGHHDTTVGLHVGTGWSLLYGEMCRKTQPISDCIIECQTMPRLFLCFRPIEDEDNSKCSVFVDFVTYFVKSDTQCRL